MSTCDEFCDFMECLRCDPHLLERKKHRLPLEYYASSDCEFMFTITMRQGQPFRRAELAQSVVQSLLWRKRMHRWTLYCYCLMPDHLHFVVRLPPSEVRLLNGGARGIVPEGILDQVGNFKKYTTTQIWWKQGGEGRLWHRSSYDRVIRYQNSVESAIHYVLNNPVRKGLVERWEDYAYSAIVDPW
jgi:REP element-mobilizing transposase RayT